MKHVFKKTALAITLCTAFAAQVAAVTLDEVASKTVQTNPEVTAKWREFRASAFERNVSWGRNLPTLDVLFGLGHQSRESPTYTPPGKRSYNTQNGKITLKQNLFEGFATVNDTKRLEHATMVRFYEMLDSSEMAALAAASAYVDVWRYRKLVEYAEENYVAHRLTHEKVKERAQSGIGRQVDLETATGRLALAEANLLTETANLHDVSARYQRIVGELPPATLSPPPNTLSQGLPRNLADSINLGYEKSPKLKAAFENILSAKRNVEVQKAGYMPRVDAFAELARDRNASGYTGNTNEQTLGVTMTWNLFRGNQDKSREQKTTEEVFFAKDMREKTCREVRQNLSMSFNDHLRLSEQLKYHDQHQLSSNKVREAFRDQFDIGQRTLLDVLDVENEYYTSRRDYLNSEMDLMVANAKYQATAGNLLNVLNLKALDMNPPNPVTEPDPDMFTTCPAEAVDNPITDKEGLFNRAWDKDKQTRKPMPVPVSAAVKQIIKTAKPVVLTGANFDFDSDQLKPNADEKLQSVVDFAKQYPEANMDVIGHTDWMGTDEYNMDLSKRRANTVKQWLVKRGIDENRVSVKFMGEAQPVATNDTKEGRAQNRRVEIHYTVMEEQEVEVPRPNKGK